MTGAGVDRLTHASELYAAGKAANEDMRPQVGSRKLRAALVALGDANGDGPEERALRGRAMVSLAMAEAELGRVDLGMELLVAAAEFVAPDQRAVLHAQRAILLRRTGRDDQAISEYAEALTLLDEETQPELVAKVLMNRAVLCIAAGDLRAARRDLGRCLDLARSLRDEVLVAKSFHNLGYLEYIAGNLPPALRRYAEAEPYYRRLLPGNLAMLGLDRARALVAAGLVTEADRELAVSVAQLAEQRSFQDQAEGLLVRAEAALLDGRPRDARTFAAAAHAVFRRRDNQRWAARALLTAARADLATGRRTDVAARDEELRDTFRRWSLADDARTAASVAALAHVRSGEIDQARTLVAVPAARGGRIETTLLSRMARAELADAEGRHHDASRERRRGLESLHRARTRIGALDLQGGAALLGRELARGGLQRAVATGSTSSVFAWAERARAQALLLPPVRLEQDDRDTWQALRATTLALSAAELNGQPTATLLARRDALRRAVRHGAWSTEGPGGTERITTLHKVRALLGSSAMVVYVADGDNLLAVVVTDRSARLVRLGSVLGTEEAILRLRADLDAAAGRSLPASLADAIAATTRRDADAVGAALLDQVLPLVGDRDLVVVPTGAIITVPWTALPMTNGRPVTVASSASTWALRQDAPGSGPRTTLLAGGPRVPRGEAEIAAIATLPRKAESRQPTVLVRNTATVAAVLDALSVADVAHVAAHGHHETDNALFSGIELSDGLLMGYDLLGLHRVPPVVVLSSCDLGLHDTRPGDESLGTASALLAAGSRTVVASVSRVDDDEAMDVMVGFHRGLLAGARPVEALATATTGRQTGFVCFGAG